MKKLLIILLTLVTSVCYADDYFRVGDIMYKITSVQDMNVEVYCVYKNAAGPELVFPATVEYNDRTFHVKKIADTFDAIVNKVVISEGIEEIGNGAFHHVRGIVNLEFPSTIKKVGSEAFDRVENTYIKDLKSWCNIDFKDSQSNPAHAGGRLYVNGELLVDAVIPDGVRCIKRNAFAGMAELKSITLPNSVTEIKSYAFYYNRNLERVVIGTGIKAIDSSIFNMVETLKSITILSPEPPIMIGPEFSNAKVYTFANLYIPQGSTEAYKDSSAFAKFAVIKEQ